MPRGFGQLAGQRLGGDDQVGLLFLVVVEAPALLIVTAGRMHPFHKRPSQVDVPALAIVLALVLAVARAQAGIVSIAN